MNISGDMLQLSTTFKGEETSFLFSPVKCVFAPELGSIIEWDLGGIGVGFQFMNPGKKDVFSGKKIRVPAQEQPSDSDLLRVIQKLPDVVTDFRCLILLAIVHSQFCQEHVRSHFSVAGGLKSDLKQAFQKAEMGVQASPPIVDMNKLKSVGDDAFSQGLLSVSHMLRTASYSMVKSDEEAVHFQRLDFDAPSGVQ